MFSIVRFLDPGNPKSAKKRLYNTNIIQEFDKHYQKRTANKSVDSTATCVTPPGSSLVAVPKLFINRRKGPLKKPLRRRQKLRW
jgi:hypothetical protein